MSEFIQQVMRRTLPLQYLSSYGECFYHVADLEESRRTVGWSYILALNGNVSLGSILTKMKNIYTTAFYILST